MHGLASRPLARAATLGCIALGAVAALGAVNPRATGAPPTGPTGAVAGSREQKPRGSRAPAHCRGIHARASSLKRLRGSGHQRGLGCRPLTRRSVSPAIALERARASAIASVLATPCQNTELAPSPADVELVRAAVMCLINRERAVHLEMPLKPNPELQQAAEGHSAEMVAEDYFQHISPSGLTPVDRVSITGYIPSPLVGYVIGENIAWGTLTLSTPQAIVAAWIASPPHLANILEAQYDDTGIGISPEAPPALADGAPGATYTQDFGVIVE
jgi:uncharacterized protein YkwD